MLADTLDLLGTLDDRTSVPELAMRLDLTERSVERRLAPLKAYRAVETRDGMVVTTDAGRELRETLLTGSAPPTHPDIARASLAVLACTIIDGWRP